MHGARHRALPGGLRGLVGVQREERPRLGEGDPVRLHRTKHFTDLLTNNVVAQHRREAGPAVPAVVPELGADRRHDGAADDDARGARRLRVQPLPLQGAAASGCSFLLLIQMFPQLRRGRGDLPDRLQHRRRLPGARPERQPLAVIFVFLGGSMGVQAWLMKGFFDTIPSRAGRVGARRRRDRGPDLLGRRAAAGRAGAVRRRPDLVRVHPERVRDHLGAARRRPTSSRCRSG